MRRFVRRLISVFLRKMRFGMARNSRLRNGLPGFIVALRSFEVYGPFVGLFLMLLFLLFLLIPGLTLPKGFLFGFALIPTILGYGFGLLTFFTLTKCAVSEASKPTLMCLGIIGTALGAVAYFTTLVDMQVALPDWVPVLALAMGYLGLPVCSWLLTTVVITGLEFSSAMVSWRQWFQFLGSAGWLSLLCPLWAFSYMNEFWLARLGYLGVFVLAVHGILFTFQERHNFVPEHYQTALLAMGCAVWALFGEAFFLIVAQQMTTVIAVGLTTTLVIGSLILIPVRLVRHSYRI
jgi:hypothetical protein